ncbi:MAG: hypothetical protein HDQ88_07940 [Clostridia bacterium]|nr:hypothetical protein [Clostridia bacterium]
MYTNDNKFYNYAISDENGQLCIEVSDSDIIEFSYLGYTPLNKPAKDFILDRINNVILAEKAIELNEVIVKAPPIREQNDTISYNVRAFIQAGDSHLEDILKKLPGIRVNENGSISYQGKAINKFYIEGKDLLGNSYSLATKNMPVEAVTTVEVLENHQPFKMLKGKQLSDKAAINIRIDRGHKSRPFGEINVGLGEIASIWNNSLFLTQIMSNSQLLISGKINNSGVDLSEETKEHIDIADLDAYEPILPSILSTSTLNEVLPQNRYLQNKSYSAGANFLVGLSKESSLRFNLLYYQDRSNITRQRSDYYGGENPLNLIENTAKRLKDFTILPIIKYELNDKNTYISNELKLSFNKISSSNRVISNSISLFERIDNKPVYLQNYFTSSFYIKNRIVQAKSLSRYFNRSENLYSDADTISIYDISEKFALKSFLNKTILSSLFYLGGNSLNISSEIYYMNTLYDYKENIRSNKFSLKISPNYLISFGTNRYLSIILPIELFNINIIKRHKTLLAFIPNINFRYQINNNWRININASYNVDNNTLGFYSHHLLRTGYRTEYLPTDRIFFNSSKKISASLAYRNLATMLFSNLSISYSDGKKESYSNYNYTDSITQISTIAGTNHLKTFLVNGSLDKSFVDVGISLKSDLNYSGTKYLVSQSAIRFYNNSNILSINLDLNYQKLKWFKVMLTTTGTLYWEKNDLYSSEPIKSLIVNNSIYFFPISNLSAKLKYQNFINEITTSKYKNYGVFDFNMDYKINKRWEIEFSLSNILNTRSYSVTQESGINIFNTSLPLRGREYLISVLWRF